MPTVNGVSYYDTVPGQPWVNPVPAQSSYYPGFGGGVSSAEPLQMAEQNRMRAASSGDAMEKYTTDQANQYNTREGQFLNWAQSGQGGYGDILGGQGGYNQSEQDNLLQQGLVGQALTNPQELQRQYLDANEQRNIQGNPYDARNLAVGQLGALEQRYGSTKDWQMGSLQPMADMYNNAIAASATGMPSENYYGNMTGLVNRAGEGYNDIIDPTKLGVNPEYYGATNEAIGNLATGYGQVIDPQYLGVSSEYLTNYNLTPRNMQDMVDQAGRSVGMRGQAQREAFQRDANSYGNSNPLAVEAMANRNKIYSDIAAGDAMTNARIQAKQLGLDVAGNREGMRLDTERDIAGRATGAMENLANTQLNQAQTGEQMRIGSEQGIADRASQAWSETTGRRLGVEDDYEKMRQQAVQQVSQNMMQKAADEGAAGIGVVRNVATDAQNIGRYGTDMLTGLTQSAEAQASNRSADIAQNRQNIGYGNIDTMYGQYMPAAQQQSGVYGGIYGQRKAEEQEGRGFLSGQQTAAQSGAMASTDQRINAAANQNQAIQGATTQAINAKYIPTALDKGLAVLSGTFGG